MASTRNRRILYASRAGLAQRGIQLITTLITLPLVLHALGVAEFGIWGGGAATSLAWLSGMLDLGPGSALVTLIPRSIAVGETETARSYVTAALTGGCAVAALLLAAGFAVIEARGLHVTPSFLVAGIAVALNIPLSIAAPIWLGLQKGHMAAVWQIFQTLLTLAFLLAATTPHAGVTAMVTAVYAAMLLANTACLAHLFLAHPNLAPRHRLQPAALRTVLHQGGLMFAITVAASCTYVFDNLMALDWLGPTASAQMAIAMRVCLTATGILSVLVLPFWPGFADAIETKDRRWQWQTLRNGTLANLGLSIMGSTMLIAFGGSLLHWWLHQNLTISPTLLWVMAAWITLTTLTNIPSLLLHAALWLRPQILTISIAAAVSFILKYFAAEAFGVAGLLSVTPLLWLFFVIPIYFYLSWRWTSPTLDA